MPGAQYVPHTGVNDILGVRSTIITTAAGPLAGRQLLVLACSSSGSSGSCSSGSISSSSISGRYLMDITGPWRTA